MAERVWTAHSLAILALLDSNESIHAYGAMRRTGLEASVVYMTLRRFARWGLVTATPEAQLVKPGAKNGQQRVFYRMTEAGRMQLVQLRSLLTRRAA